MLSSSFIVIRDCFELFFSIDLDLDFYEAGFEKEEFKGFWLFATSLPEEFSEQETELPEGSSFCRGSDRTLEVELFFELFVLLILLRGVTGGTCFCTSGSDYELSDSSWSSPHSLSNF